MKNNLKPLRESMGGVILRKLPVSLNESVVVDGKGHKVLAEVEGPMTVVGIKNGNNRTYPLKEVQNAITTMKPVLTANAVLGELDHPPIERDHTSLKEVSHMIRDMWIEKRPVEVIINDQPVKGVHDVLMGKWAVLDTPNGKILNTLIDSGVAVGTSMRGWGQVNEMGEVSDFLLKTVDAVDDPSSGTRLVSLSSEADPAKEPSVEFPSELKDALDAMFDPIFAMTNESNNIPTEVVDRMVRICESNGMSELSSKFVKLKEDRMKHKTKVQEMDGPVPPGAAIPVPGDTQKSEDAVKAELLKKEEEVRAAAASATTQGDVEDKAIAGMQAQTGSDQKIAQDNGTAANAVLEDNDPAKAGGESPAQSGADAPKQGDAAVVTEGDDGEDDDDEDYATMQEELDDTKAYAKGLEEAVTVVRDHALKLESTLEETKKYVGQLEEACEELRSYARLAEEESAKVLADEDKELAKATGMVAMTKAELDKKEKELTESRKTIAALESKAKIRKPLEESVRRDVVRMIETYPQLEAFRDELMESNHVSTVMERARKYLGMFSTKSNLVIPNLSESTETRKDGALLALGKFNNIPKGLK